MASTVPIPDIAPIESPNAPEPNSIVPSEVPEGFMPGLHGGFLRRGNPSIESVQVGKPSNDARSRAAQYYFEVLAKLRRIANGGKGISASASVAAARELREFAHGTKIINKIERPEFIERAVEAAKSIYGEEKLDDFARALASAVAGEPST